MSHADCHVDDVDIEGKQVVNCFLLLNLVKTNGFFSEIYVSR